MFASLPSVIESLGTLEVDITCATKPPGNNLVSVAKPVKQEDGLFLKAATAICGMDARPDAFSAILNQSRPVCLKVRTLNRIFD